MKTFGPSPMIAVGLMAALATLLLERPSDDLEPPEDECRAASPRGELPPVDAIAVRVGDLGEAPDGAASLADDPVEPPCCPDPEEPLDALTWEVVVLDSTGVPIPGVTVSTEPAPPSYHRPADVAITDAAGRAAVKWWDTERFDVVTSGVVPRERWTLTEPVSVLQYGELLPLEVTVIDARTGHSMGPGCSVTLEGEPLGQLSLGWREDRFVLPLSPAWRSGTVALKFKVDVPRGFAILTREVRDAPVVVGAYATGVRARVIARPEALVRLRFENAEGSPFPGVSVLSATLGGIHSQEVGPDLSGVDGVLLVRGIPDLPGEFLRLVVEGGGHSAALAPIPLKGDGTLHEANVVLRGTYRGPAGGYMCGWPGGSTGPDGPEGGNSTARFTVRRHGGGAAAGATVRLEGECLRRPEEGPAFEDAWRLEAKSDAGGRVHFERVPRGRVFAEVRQAGFVWMREEIDVVEGDTQSFTLQEPTGRTVRVAVTDPRGTPIPFASLEVRLGCSVDFAPSSAGFQDLGFWTDRNGICDIPGVPDTGVEVYARFGSRSDSERLPAGEDHLRIVLSDGR